MRAKTITLVLFILFLIFSCKNASRKSEEPVLTDAGSLNISNNSGTEGVEEIYRNFSSPMELANLFQALGVPFSSDFLALSLNAKEQTTLFEKALYLGILGTDLGYLNMYEKTGTSIELVSSIKKLAEGLKVGQFFDFEAIKRLSLSRSNLDSLLFLSTDSYRQINKYLGENNRSQLSSLMIAGAWIEAQYFATQVIKEYPENSLRDRIGEQKIVVNDLIKIISPFCKMDEQFTELCGYFRDIWAKYENVRITYTQGTPESTEKDGGLVVTQTESSMVEMTDKQLADIIEITGKVRNKLVTVN
jgi:hypothetical protein